MALISDYCMAVPAARTLCELSLCESDVSRQRKEHAANREGEEIGGYEL